MGKDSSPPPAPDYTAAANATAQGNIDAARIATSANRVDQYTPWGSLTYSRGGGRQVFDQAGYDAALQAYQDSLSRVPGGSGVNTGGGATVGPLSGVDTGLGYGNIAADMVGGGFGSNSSGISGALSAPNRDDYYMDDPDHWSSTVTLSPEQQALLDQQNKISLGLGSAMENGLQYVNDTMSNPLDTSGFTQMDQATVGGLDQITRAMMERAQPYLDAARQTRENNLLIQGHNRGGEAWGAVQNDLMKGENDALLAAILSGGQEQSRLLGLQQAQRQAQLSEAGYLRNEPINTLNAVRTGAQVTAPTFTNVPQQQTTQGPNLLNAANAQYQGNLNAYNADQASSGNFMSGLFSLGGAALGSPWLGGLF